MHDSWFGDSATVDVCGFESSVGATGGEVLGAIVEMIDAPSESVRR